VEWVPVARDSLWRMILWKVGFQKSGKFLAQLYRPQRFRTGLPIGPKRVRASRTLCWEREYSPPLSKFCVLILILNTRCLIRSREWRIPDASTWHHAVTFPAVWSWGPYRSHRPAWWNGAVPRTHSAPATINTVCINTRLHLLYAQTHIYTVC